MTPIKFQTFPRINAKSLALICVHLRLSAVPNCFETAYKYFGATDFVNITLMDSCGSAPPVADRRWTAERKKDGQGRPFSFALKLRYGLIPVSRDGRYGGKPMGIRRAARTDGAG